MARDGLRSHLSGSVPISIAAHLVVLLLLVIAPLAADIALPPPETGLGDFIQVAQAPPPPPFVPATPHPHAAVAADPNLAPTWAPSRIEPEATLPGPQFDVPVGVDAGVPPGVGIDTGAVTVTPPPPPEPPRPTTVRVAQLPQPPRKIVDARPVYPEIARHARVEGTVILEAVLDTSGNITEPRIIRSVPLLDRAALDAVRQWKYTPTIYGGRPVSVLMTITIRFTLNP